MVDWFDSKYFPWLRRFFPLYLAFCSTCNCLIFDHHVSLIPETGRREILSIAQSFVIGQTLSVTASEKAVAIPTEPETNRQVLNSAKNWEATSLNLLSPSDAITYLKTKKVSSFQMGRWPDPILRVPSRPTPSYLLNTSDLKIIADGLRQTSRANKAVGLAAQQCGIQMSLIFLDIPRNKYSVNRSKKDSGVFLVNPRFISRSIESEMKVWEEECLVLPPDFHATVLRDSQVLVEAEDLLGKTFRVSLNGEEARAIQHECDHDRGILITDHVGEEEMRNKAMWNIEKEGHVERQQKAFDRYLGTPIDSNIVKDELIYGSNNLLSMVPPDANEKLSSKVSACDDVCLNQIKARRALSKQSRSTSSRQEVFELSRQRAALYNATYGGASCVDGLPCY